MVVAAAAVAKVADGDRDVTAVRAVTVVDRLATAKAIARLVTTAIIRREAIAVVEDEEVVAAEAIKVATVKRPSKTVDTPVGTVSVAARLRLAATTVASIPVVKASVRDAEALVAHALATTTATVAMTAASAVEAAVAAATTTVASAGGVADPSTTWATVALRAAVRA